MNKVVELVKKAREYIRSKSDRIPQVGIVLGTGLGGLAHEIETDVTIPYHEIPGFVSSTVESHEGQLIIPKKPIF